MKTMVSIRTRTGMELVEAEPVGPWFAVHPTATTDGPSPTDWTVTHTPSGWACHTSCKSPESAFAVAERLEAVPVDWSAVREVDDELLKPHFEALKAALKVQA